MVYAAASGVGTSLLQLCKSYGIRTIAISSNENKLDFCKSVGADFIINYKSCSQEEFI